MRTTTIPATQAFRNEIKEASQLGFLLKVSVTQGQTTVRAQPTTPAARSACFAATGQPNQELEAKTPGASLDHVREAVQAVLNRAREITA